MVESIRALAFPFSRHRAQPKELRSKEVSRDGVSGHFPCQNCSKIVTLKYCNIKLLPSSCIAFFSELGYWNIHSLGSAYLNKLLYNVAFIRDELAATKIFYARSFNFSPQIQSC